MAPPSARADRASRFHSSGSERGHSSPAADYAAAQPAYDDDFDDFDDPDDLLDRDLLRHRRVFADDDGPDGLSSLADDLIDDLVPPEVDWRKVVRRHPLPTLLLAGLGGYLLGRSQGRTLLSALSALAVARVEAEVLTRIEDDLG
ncbi:MAG: hypothetical protein KBI44_17665 [Thermoanaerobaculia bacterium]|nr:hypothetical protein [Thermoanaerobaculia bacterium]